MIIRKLWTKKVLKHWPQGILNKDPTVWLDPPTSVFYPPSLGMCLLSVPIPKNTFASNKILTNSFLVTMSLPNV
jgi:hypothetical protein